MNEPVEQGTTMTTKHPCQYSPEVLHALEPYIPPGLPVHDPFAGPGIRLGALCDRLGATFTGTDIEAWPGADPRVVVGDARDPATYPSGRFAVITSPVYVNKRCADYANGPKPTTQLRGRRDYGIALGRALHPFNLARTTGRPARVADYWREHGKAVKHWGELVALNVDEPIGDQWCNLLIEHGYEIDAILPVHTQRYGGLDNAEKRAEHEVVILALRGG